MSLNVFQLDNSFISPFPSRSREMINFSITSINYRCKRPSRGRKGKCMLCKQMILEAVIAPAGERIAVWLLSFCFYSSPDTVSRIQKKKKQQPVITCVNCCVFLSNYFTHLPASKFLNGCSNNTYQASINTKLLMLGPYKVSSGLWGSVNLWRQHFSGCSMKN